jgi:hypothetical protein
MIIDCLEIGRIQNDIDRFGNIDENLLATGQVSVHK